MQEPEDFGEELFESPLPNAIEAEIAVLGLILMDETLLFQAIELAEPIDFYLPSHRAIYEAMISCFERGENITPVAVNQELKRHGHSQSAGGVTGITKLSYGIPHTTNLEPYLKHITDTARLRRLYSISNANAEAAREAADEPEAILQRAEQQIFELTSQRYKSGLLKVGDLLEEVLDAAEANIGCGHTATGLDTGFTEINDLTSGFQRSDLILLAARPKLGKSTLAQCIVNNAAIRNGKLCAFFSLEMSKESLIARGLCSEARVNHQNYRKGYLNHEEWARIENLRPIFEAAPIYIDDTPAITVLEIKAKCLRLQSRLQRPLDLVVIDYLQLMTGSANSRRESRQQEVSGISRDLKKLAKQLNVPLLALSQLNRSPEQRNDKRPQLADLRESGSLEMDADLVLFIYREAEYKKDLSEGDKHLAEINIAKQRNGPSGTAMLRFDGPTFRFDNLQQF